jgi:UrcA family protein
MKKLNILLAAAAIAVCTAAQADTHGQQSTVTVQYSLTEVATAQGVRTLYGRLPANRISPVSTVIDPATAE